MPGYAKLFSDIVDSSIWEQPSDVCKVWVTLLALASADGFVRGSPGWLAGKARVSMDICRESLHTFQQPDPHSRTEDHDGRRIEEMDDGWLILNYLAFRNRLSDDAKAVRTRERVQKHRERYNALRNAASVTSVDSASASSSVSEKKKKGTVFTPPTPEDVAEYSAEIGYPLNSQAWCDIYAQKGWMVGRSKMKDWKAAVRNWKTNGYTIGNKQKPMDTGI